MDKKQIGYSIILILYTAVLVWLVIFKMSFSLADIYPARAINFIPFYYPASSGDIPLYEIILNVILFIPLGFLLYKTFKRMTFSRGGLTVFLVSLAFEILQYALSVGVSDITDLITNTAGGGIGFYLAAVFTKPGERHPL